MFPELDGPTHRYLQSSPGCWSAYGEVLAREYSNPSYAAEHRLTVDAYAVQHPGRESPQTIQSVALHLISLRLILREGYTTQNATRAMQQAAKMKSKFHWLLPPATRGSVTVADVHKATSAKDHKEMVRKWAEEAWVAWSEHHDIITQWLPKKR